jgi:ribonucleoside-diphosphate reductase alpha chain
MQTAQENTALSPSLGVSIPESSGAGRGPYADYKIIRRNGAVVGFEPAKISVAMTKAFLAVNGAQGAASARIREVVAGLTEAVVGALVRRQPQGGTFHIEDIQDQVELALMRSGEHDVARSYVLYREERSRARLQEKAGRAHPAGGPADASRSTCMRCASRSPPRAKASRTRSPSPSSKRRCAISTTACRSTRCASRRCSRHGR